MKNVDWKKMDGIATGLIVYFVAMQFTINDAYKSFQFVY